MHCSHAGTNRNGGLSAAINLLFGAVLLVKGLQPAAAEEEEQAL